MPTGRLLVVLLATLVIASAVPALAAPPEHAKGGEKGGAGGSDKPAPAGKPADVGKPLGVARELSMTLTGTATEAETGDVFQLEMTVSGTVYERTNRGEGTSGHFRGEDLVVEIRTFTVEDDGEGGSQEVDRDVRTVLVAIHGNYSPYLAEGVDGFKFNLQSRGRAGDVLHLGLHGDATEDGDGGLVVAATGQLNLKRDAGATNHLLAAAGPATVE